MLTWLPYLFTWLTLLGECKLATFPEGGTQRGGQ